MNIAAYFWWCAAISVFQLLVRWALDVRARRAAARAIAKCSQAGFEQAMYQLARRTDFHAAACRETSPSAQAYRTAWQSDARARELMTDATEAVAAWRRTLDSGPVWRDG